MDNRPNKESGQPRNTDMGTMTMTPRSPTSGMGSGVSLPPLMEVLGDLWRAPHSEQPRYNIPRKVAERESPMMGRRALPLAISSIASVLDTSSSYSSPSSKRRKVNSPERRPLSLTIPSPNRAESSAQGKEGTQTTVRYTGYQSVQPPAENDIRRLSSTSHPETTSLPPVSAITGSRGSSSESERHGVHSFSSLLSPTQPPPTPNTSGSRYQYDPEYPHPYNSSTYYRHSGEYGSYLPPSPPMHTLYSSHNPSHPAPLLTQTYPIPQGGVYIPRPSQPGPIHDRSPFSPTIHGGMDSYDQVARLGTKRRRGNLPKHVTDTLRTWLTNHVAHPYPTEEEKQQLCQITGLNMNQISNWFINARRRKLPQQRSDAEQHFPPQPITTTPPRPLGHTRSHSRDATARLPPPPPLHPPGSYASSGR